MIANEILFNFVRCYILRFYSYVVKPSIILYSVYCFVGALVTSIISSLTPSFVACLCFWYVLFCLRGWKSFGKEKPKPKTKGSRITWDNTLCGPKADPMWSESCSCVVPKLTLCGPKADPMPMWSGASDMWSAHICFYLQWKRMLPEHRSDALCGQSICPMWSEHMPHVVRA